MTQQFLDQAKLALNLAQTRYNLGLSSIVELSQAQLQQTQAQISDVRRGVRLPAGAGGFAVSDDWNLAGW